MLINRRLYRFIPVDKNAFEGLLTLDGVTKKARRKERSSTANQSIDSMTGRKEVVQYYDEFETLDAFFVIAGEADRPQWVTR